MSRKKDIGSFKVLDCSGESINSFLSSIYHLRAKAYRRFKDKGIVLPPYATFERESLRKEDMKVVEEDWWIVFEYKGTTYKLTAFAGACWDGASVPTALVHGNVAKHTQKANIPAIVHDFLFASRSLPLDDANNIFSGLLRWQGLNKVALAQYMIGVRSGKGKRIFESGNPETHWLLPFCELEILRSPNKIEES